MSTPTAHARLFKLILLSVSTLIALGLAEIGLRVVHHYRYRAAIAHHRAADGQVTVVSASEPNLYFKCRPDFAGTNSRGFFDVEHTFTKPSDVFRIVIIGDSVVVGHEVGWRASFGKLLEHELNRLALRRRVETILLACSGYSTSQELVLLRDEAFRYQPDLVLWCYVLNDPAHPLYHAASGDLALVYQPKFFVADLLQGGWFRLCDWYRGLGGPKEFHKRLHYIYWDEVVANLHEIGRLCGEHHVPCLFMIHPVFALEERPGEYSYLDVHVNLEEAASAAGLSVVDLLAAYQGRPRDEVALKDDPWHPNLLGHQMLADFLCRYLVVGNWVPMRNGP
jgi:hypothetical protein